MENFIAKFCEVQFLCYQKSIYVAPDPNWLGWLVLGIGSLIAWFITWGVGFSVCDAIDHTLGGIWNISALIVTGYVLYNTFF